MASLQIVSRPACCHTCNTFDGTSDQAICTPHSVACRRRGVYIAGGITPRLLPHLQSSPTKGGALLEGFLCRAVRTPFKELLASMPLAVITNDKVGQIGAREYARLLAAGAL
ncbi:hypothetical protein DUNSADRAFT_5956 [Dunaliella salina]|uniref:Glucokinase n=1 Tax=Dunaliella salina TaxID=3046 RepID=A0ABQ7FU14_DUNSA|nr:hypothetical protein DUNSADRAFT_5956 [Dunaliella salina]|eukprot:KAF5825916.1 hypothetical protein DUNSADRAFT_5956 [Dunaliella salina]